MKPKLSDQPSKPCNYREDSNIKTKDRLQSAYGGRPQTAGPRDIPAKTANALIKQIKFLDNRVNQKDEIIKGLESELHHN